MKTLLKALIIVTTVLTTTAGQAHPGSGIATDDENTVYFADTGSGNWKLENDTNLTQLTGPAVHWLAYDKDNRLDGIELPSFSRGSARVTRTPERLLLSSDFPIAISAKGELYYPWQDDNGKLTIFRLDSNGTTSRFAEVPNDAEGREVRWLNDIALGKDESIYYTTDRAVTRITPQGKNKSFVVELPERECQSIPGIRQDQQPFLRGIDVDTKGNVYVAASGCGALLKVATNQDIELLFQTSSPWAPTGVVVMGDNLYILEYLHTEGDNRQQWLPRVRKIGGDGSVKIVATVKH